MANPVIPSAEFNDQIKRVVRDALRENRLIQPSKGGHTTKRIRRHQGVLLDDVAGSTDPLATPNYGTVRVVKQVPGSATLAVTSLCIEVAYRFTVPDLEAGSFCKIEFIDGEWSFYTVDCEDSGLPTTECA